VDMNYLNIDPKETPLPQLHQYLLGSIGPRPICFASTIDENGRPNLAPFSFFNVFSANPPVIIFAPNNSGRDGTPKHTYLNAKQVPEVVVNVVNEEIVEKMNVAAAPWDRGISEFEKAGFTPLKSEIVKPFRVAESPVQMECKVLEVKELGTGGGAGNLVIAEVVKIHIHANLIDDDGRINQQKIGLVGRMGGSWYCKTSPDNMFQLSQPMTKVIGFDGLPDLAKNSRILSANDLGKMAALPNLPNHDLVKKMNETSAGENVEERAKKLISENKISEALALFL
jgi:flavin reductase (DIM6/NTAB) family NADH-FMN oxidoreductase RutF